MVTRPPNRPTDGQAAAAKELTEETDAVIRALNRIHDRPGRQTESDAGQHAAHQRGAGQVGIGVPSPVLRHLGSIGRCSAVLAACFLCAAAPVRAAVLRSADVQIIMASPTSCLVTMRLTVDDATEVEHRIEILEGTRVELVGVHGARQVDNVPTIGRTLSLVLRSEQAPYEFSYRIAVPISAAHRCPIWLPTVPTDGRSRAVRLQTELPAGSAPGTSMPPFTWNGTQGVATLGHLPAVVRVPYTAAGQRPGWTLASVMDGLAVAVFAAATAVWTWRVRR